MIFPILFFSDSQANSAQLIASLAEKERSKGHGLPPASNILPASPDFRKMMPFYESLPEVGLGTALQLKAAYKNLLDFVTSARWVTFEFGALF